MLDTVVQFVPRQVSAATDATGVMQVGRLTFDQREGIGSLSDSTEIVQRGFACMMFPRQYQALATPRNFMFPSNLRGISKAIALGDAVGSPWLDVIMDPDSPDATPRVMAHDGRTRVEAIRRLYGETAILIHVFLRHMKACDIRHMKACDITLDHVRTFQTYCGPKDRAQTALGPHCHDIVFLHNEWQDLNRARQYVLTTP